MVTLGAMAEFRSGTGSTPPLAKEWHRATRRNASHEPLHTPNRTSATYAYSEHVGRYTHSDGLKACSTGDNKLLYNQYTLRTAKLGWGSGIVSAGRRSLRLGLPPLLPRTFFNRLLDGAEHISHLPLEHGKLQVDHAPPRM